VFVKDQTPVVVRVSWIVMMRTLRVDSIGARIAPTLAAHEAK
jgi:hypothetical protein